MGNKKKMIDPNTSFVINARILTGHTLHWENGIIKIYNRFGMLDTVFNAAYMPSVDAVEVVYGQWERIDKYDEDSNVRCSRCKMEFDYIDGMCYLVEGVELPNYCPNCGADMR